MTRIGARLTLAGIIALCAFAPIAVGTVHLWSICVATGIATAVLGLVLYRRIARGREAIHVGWVGLAFLLCAAWTALQLFPLPPSLLSAISPRAHEILEFTLGPFGGYGDDAWRPLSLDPAATAQELVKLLGLSAAYLAALNAFDTRSEANAVLGAIAVIGLFVVAIGVLQKATGTRTILGLYTSPAIGSQFFTATFVNPNHLAAFLGLATPVALALALRDSQGTHSRALFAGCGIVCAIGVLLSLSRAGIVAVALGQLVFLVLLWRRKTGSPRRILVVAGVVGVALGASAFALWDRLVAELLPERILQDLEGNLKVALWRDSLPLLGDFAATGIGKGAFPYVFPLYQTNLAQYTYTHVENEYLQAVLDHGVIVGGFAVLAVVGRVGRLLFSRLTTTACGLAAALVTVALHNLADFNLEVGGVAFPFAVLLGILLRPTNGDPRRPRSQPRRLTAVLAGACVAGGVAALAVAAPYAHRHENGRAIERIRTAPPEALERVATEEVARHPADYLLFLTAASRLSGPPRPDPRRAIRFANRALYLNNASYQTHWVTARILRLIGRRSQALLEYRLAVRRAPRMFEHVLLEVQGLPDSLQAMLAIAEDAPLRRRLAAFLIGRQRPADAAHVAGLLLDADPRDPAALALAARAELSRARPSEALALAQRLATLPGKEAEAAMLAGEAHGVLGKMPEALSAYEKARTLDPRLSDAYLRIAAIRLARGEAALARQTLDELRRVDIRAAAEPAVSMLLARAWEIEGKPARALREYRRVLARQPGNAEAAARAKALEGRVGK